MSLDDHIRSALDRALTGVRGHLEADLRAFAQDLARAAAEERGRAVREAAEAAAADVRRQAQAQLTQFRDAAQKHADELRRTTEAQLSELKQALEETRRNADQLVDAARRTAQTEVDTARRSAQAEIAAARRAAEAKVEDLKTSTDRRIAELTEEIARIRKDAAADAEGLVATRIAARAAEHERRLTQAVERVRTDHHQAVLAQTARLADGVRSLDEARSLGEVLDTLAECAGREVDRVAVLVVKDDRVTGWRLSGFAADAPPARSIGLSLDEAGLAGAVVRTGVAVSRPAAQPGPADARQPALPPFAQDAGTRHALALPVIVGGAVAAVLYADAPRLEAPSAASRWPAVLDVLVRHASRALEAMTVQQAAGLSLPRPLARGSHAPLPGPVEHAGGEAEADAARRYARLLLSEVRMFNEPLVDAGRRSRDLLTRLGGEIARARRLYEARVPSTVSARSEYFDQELVRTLADGDRSLLGSVP
ncbi:MAG: GAF domain-containing protein [Acidobacteria bacterium]|nr:GAF domain-containing protein [Acidobacteriota bacterium]